jgi:hypothetical protein
VVQAGGDLRLAPTDAEIAKRQTPARAALCRCDCGQERLVSVLRLVRGRLSSCSRGCPAKRTSPVGRGEESTEDGTTEPRRARGGRRAQPIPDLDRFQPLVDEFLRAAALDESYAVAICDSAVRVATKRRVWSIRVELRDAEQAARKACAAAGPRDCRATAPCGVSALCAFSQGDLREIDPPAIAKGVSTSVRATRPQPRPESAPGYEYSLESATAPLLALREEQGTMPALANFTRPEYAEELRAKRAQQAHERYSARRAESA